MDRRADCDLVRFISDNELGGGRDDGGAAEGGGGGGTLLSTEVCGMLLSVGGGAGIVRVCIGVAS